MIVVIINIAGALFTQFIPSTFLTSSYIALVGGAPGTYGGYYYSAQIKDTEARLSSASNNGSNVTSTTKIAVCGL